MKKIITLFVAVLATMSLWAATPAGDGTYVADGKKPGNANRFYKLGDGVYIHRVNNSSWTSGLGMKIPSDNENGVAIYIDSPKKITALVKKKEDKNAVEVTFNVYSITNGATTLDAFEAGTENSTAVEVAYDNTPVATFGTSFEALENKAAEEKTTSEANLNAGYYYVVGTDNKGTCFLYSITLAAGCEAPATALTLKCDKTGEILVGDEVTFSTEGGNGADVTISGKNGETLNANKWTAVKGEHTFIASQDVKDGKCGNSVELKLTVISHDPVTSAVISGNKNAVVGKESTLTCTAENATTFQWYKNNAAISGATESEYKFTPDAAGELTFACEASNTYTATPVKSADFKVTVAEGACGLLAKIQATAKNAGTLTGEFTGTVSVSSDGTNSTYEGEKGYKLSSQGSHVGATFTEGTLKAGDKVTVFVTKVSDGKKLQLFSDKGTTLIAETDQLELGANIFVLDDRANGGTGLFAYRTLSGTEGAQYNAQIAYIELKRSCGNESSDASIKSLTVNGQNATLEGTTYSYELPANFDDEQVTIAWELNDAYASADQTSPLQKLFENELTVKIKVTAEDGTVVEYTVHITKAEAPKSNDATIKVLKIENKVIAAVNDTFAYKVPANENLSAVQVEFELNDAKAEADKTSPFIINVPAADAAPNEDKINVTAEDGVTKKTYVVSISRGEEQGVENVTDGAKAVKVLRNGQLLIIRNGETYNVIGGRQ